MGMKFGLVLAGLAFATLPVLADENRKYRDVYYGVCQVAQQECEQDWGSGQCRVPNYAMGHQIVTSEVLFGEGGGDDSVQLPACVWVSPAYTERLKSVTKPQRIIVIDAKTRSIISFGWLDPKAEAGGG